MLNEDRNCNCMSNMSTNMNTFECENSNQTREDMLERIKSLNFAITELALYLDTHSNDEKALCLHRKYCKEYRELTDKYQKVYGPLTIEFPCNKWRWLEEPWPSFILGVTTYLQLFSLSNKKN